MSDYLTNLALRSLNSPTAIQPRLSSIFEPLIGVGPIFPRSAPVASQLESVAEQDYLAPTDYAIQGREDQEHTAEPARSLLGAPSLKTREESFVQLKTTEPAKLVLDQESKPLASVIKIAAPESRLHEKEKDVSSDDDQTVSAPPSPRESNAKVAVAVLGTTSVNVIPPAEVHGESEGISETPGNEADVSSRVSDQVYSPLQPAKPAKVVSAINVVNKKETSPTDSEQTKSVSEAGRNEDDRSGSSMPAVSTPRLSSDANSKLVVPVISLPIEKVSPETRNEVVVAFASADHQARQASENKRANNQAVAQRDSELLSKVSVKEKFSGENDKKLSSSPNLVEPHVTLETNRTEKASRSPAYIPEPSRLRTPNLSRPIANMKPHRASRSELDARAADVPPRPEVQPTINVTIGRIEVRASTPTVSRPSRQDSESPKLMGLEDYLRQRAQGGKG